jgi:hypothetical protein
MKIPPATSHEPISRAGLKSGVYAIVDSALAISAVTAAVSLHEFVLLLLFGLFGALAVFNAWIIGKQ